MVSAPHPSKRVAVVVPPANPAVEPEMRMLLPEELSIHVARLPLQPGADLRERNRTSPSFFVDAVKSFGALAIDAALIAVTGPNYSLSDAEAATLDAELKEACAAPVARASMPIQEALVALGIGTVTLVSPYEPWLTERAHVFWERRGLQVEDAVHMTEDFRPYEITTDEVATQIRALADRPNDALLFMANGVMTIPAFLDEAKGRRPMLLSSNLCGAWWLLRETGFRRGSDVFEAAAPRLAATLREK